MENRFIRIKMRMEADGIIVSCRIKPRNAFRGPYEAVSAR